MPFALLREGVTGCAGVVARGNGGGGVADVDGGRERGVSSSGDVRGGDSEGLAAEETRGVLAFLLPKREREEDGGCSGLSEVGLADADDL